MAADMRSLDAFYQKASELARKPFAELATACGVATTAMIIQHRALLAVAMKRAMECDGEDRRDAVDCVASIVIDAERLNSMLRAITEIDEYGPLAADVIDHHAAEHLTEARRQLLEETL